MKKKTRKRHGGLRRHKKGGGVYKFVTLKEQISRPQNNKIFLEIWKYIYPKRKQMFPKITNTEQRRQIMNAMEMLNKQLDRNPTFFLDEVQKIDHLQISQLYSAAIIMADNTKKINKTAIIQGGRKRRKMKGGQLGEMIFCHFFFLLFFFILGKFLAPLVVIPGIASLLTAIILCGVNPSCIMAAVLNFLPLLLLEGLINSICHFIIAVIN